MPSTGTAAFARLFEVSLCSTACVAWVNSANADSWDECTVLFCSQCVNAVMTVMSACEP